MPARTGCDRLDTPENPVDQLPSRGAMRRPEHVVAVVLEKDSLPLGEGPDMNLLVDRYPHPSE